MKDKTDIINTAQKLAAKGHIDKAIAEWQKLLEERNDGNVHNSIGDLHLKKGSDHEAVDSFAKAAEIFRKDGFYPKAIAIYKKVLNIDPNSVEALVALAKLNAEKGLIGNAVENYYRAAEIYNREGSTEKATQVVERMLQLSPTDISTREKIANLYFRIGLRDRAANEYASMGFTCLEKNDSEKAQGYYNKALEYDPKSIPALIGLSTLAENDSNIDQAFGYLDKALSHDPNNREALLNYSKLASNFNKKEDAKKTLIKLIEINPSDIEAKKLLGNIYLRDGLLEMAWEELLPFIDTALDEEKWSEAHEFLHKFKALYPIEVKKRLLRVCRAQGDDHTLSNDLKELASLYENEGSYDDALQAYKEASELNPDDSISLDKVKELEIKLGIARSSIEITTEEHTATKENVQEEVSTPQAGADDDLQELFDQFEKREEVVDYESHYNSGLDFRQKGLLDEAIGEFQIAAKDPEKKIRNSTMLALCYKEKGSFPHAIAEFSKIVDSMSPSDATFLHIKYELASAHMNNKDYIKALDIFSEIQTQDSSFKDVSAKVDSLKAQMAQTQEDKPTPKRDRVSYI
jgi:tetratricopeptide (TPR) repeat protein